MQGSLIPGALPVALRSTYVKRRTGTFRLSHGDEHCAIRFVRGHMVYGAFSEKRLHLGEVLVTQGLLSPEHLTQATDIVKKERKRLGEALKSMGVVDAELLDEFLAIQMREILIHLFSWRAGEYAFDEQDLEMKLEYDFPLKMSTAEIIMEAARRVEDRESVLFALGSLDRVLLPSADPILRFQRVTLTPIDGFVMSRVDGTLSVREVVKITPLDDEAVEKSLFALLSAGILELVPERPKREERDSAEVRRQEILDAHAALPEQNHFDRLGLTSDATDAEIKAAFLQLAKRYHPDVQHDPALKGLRDKIEEIFAALEEAHRVLSDARVRRAYRAVIDPDSRDEAPDEPEIVNEAIQAVDAQQLFDTASERYEEGKYWEAVALLGQAVPVAKGRLLKRARVLLARAYLRHPDTEKQAEKELRAVLREDPDYFDAYFYLGKLYKGGGLTARARTMFSRVLELRPSHREASSQLVELEPEAEPEQPESGGLFKKLFKRDGN